MRYVEIGILIPYISIFFYNRHKVRSGQLSQEIREKIWKLVMQKPDIADAVTDILDMELPEDETVRRVERLA